MKKRIENILTFLILVISLNSCCIGAKEDYLGNNIYLSEYDNVDRRIVYQTESCATSGVEIVPMTILEIADNNKWIIAKTGNGRKRTEDKFFKYWVIKNDYENSPNSETVKRNTTEFDNRQDFDKFLTENKIKLKLNKID
ncbi:hypothetical protein pgond44_02463 [Psychroflexus gondwanensis ACAM 44]|uniref:Uncharacterized protein n=1 Tax=Psychroflexus gondwanensis ACAM 44 TaxID=1189619 RepID=N1WP50_9FLAO|nr:hypothetical protein [Psychroflexus gondwanensis]EMY82066.1 hypothetical protein pgond44_02463 [Psychroflexus gondwanensis ACAM 44]